MNRAYYYFIIVFSFVLIILVFGHLTSEWNRFTVINIGSNRMWGYTSKVYMSNSVYNELTNYLGIRPKVFIFNSDSTIRVPVEINKLVNAEMEKSELGTFSFGSGTVESDIISRKYKNCSFALNFTGLNGHKALLWTFKDGISEKKILY